MLRDSLYDIVPLADAELRVINSQAFLRLERIQQLGFVSRIWPGARHTRFEHSLGVMCLMQQALERLNERGAGIDDESARVAIAAALLHDIGDIYAPYNHDEYAATILRPFVREQCTWVVQTHGDFQMLYYAQHVGGNPNKRDAFKGHPYFDDCAEFCEKWDQSSFDPDYETKPLEFFAPMVREVFARKAYAPDVVKKGVRLPLTGKARS